MTQRIQGFTLLDRLRLRPVLSSVVRRYGSVHATPDALRESIALVEEAINRKPREWIYWYVLADWYGTVTVGELVKSLRACEKCYELRPKDPRSAYALASQLRILARAKYAEDDQRTEVAKSVLQQLGLAAIDDYDPLASRKALGELQMTVDQAAERSLVLFEEVLTLGVRGEEARHVHDCLAAMYAEFPHLEQRVKATRGAPRGLLAEARGSPFNKAVEHYQKLRYLLGQPEERSRELLEIVQQCQLAIAKNAHDGDAYVLLANALLVAASERQLADGTAYEYFLSRAAAVIEHWATGGFYTQNRQAGLHMLESIKNELSRAKALTPTELHTRMESFRGTLLRDVLAPGSMTEVHHMLGLPTGDPA